MNTYHLTTKWKFIEAMWSITITALLFGTFAYFVRFFLVLYLIMGITALASTFYDLATERIIVSERGIEYRKLAFAFEVSWADMDEFGYYWFREGLLIEKDAIKPIFVYRPTYAILMGFGQSAFIPLSSFSNNWRSSELGKQIKQYAPRLFE